jgi:hypothetical protein
VECYRHPGVIFQAMCGGCRRPMCKECMQLVDGRATCTECAASGGMAAAAPAPPATTAAGFDRGSSFVSGSGGAAAAVLAPPAAMTGPSYEAVEVPLGQRLLQGVGWGALFGQWWTLWTVVWNLTGVTHADAMSNVQYALFYAFFGAVGGGAIAALDADVCLGQKIGIGVGVVACLIETSLSHSAGTLFCLIWYFFTGRFIGRNLARRLQSGM